MGSLLLSFKGRIGASDLLKGSIVVIALSFIISIIPYFNLSFWWLSMAGIVLLWPWLALFAKRYHDAGKSGWMALLPVVASVVLSFVANTVLGKLIPLDKSAIEAATESGDVGAIFQAGLESTVPHIIPGAISAVIVSFIIVFLFNAMIKSDPEENQFGAPTS